MADVRSGSVEFAVKAVFPLANLLVQIDIFFFPNNKRQGSLFFNKEKSWQSSSLSVNLIIKFRLIKKNLRSPPRVNVFFATRIYGNKSMFFFLAFSSAQADLPLWSAAQSQFYGMCPLRPAPMKVDERFHTVKREAQNLHFIT